jgi:hypothetical protein
LGEENRSKRGTPKGDPIGPKSIREVLNNGKKQSGYIKQKDLSQEALD